MAANKPMPWLKTGGAVYSWLFRNLHPAGWFLNINPTTNYQAMSLTYG
jgi:hypothetical protein